MSTETMPGAGVSDCVSVLKAYSTACCGPGRQPPDQPDRARGRPLCAQRPTTNGMAGLPTISGFRVSDGGQLTPITGSTQPVPGGLISGCSQVSFSPDGKQLIVSERTADDLATYPVDANGVAGPPRRNATAEIGPFGLNFAGDDVLLTAVNNVTLPLLGAAASLRDRRRRRAVAARRRGGAQPALGYVLDRDRRRRALRLHDELHERRHLELPRRRRPHASSGSTDRRYSSASQME